MLETILFLSFFVYIFAVIYILKSSRKEKIVTEQKKPEIVTSKQTCPSCKKSYEKSLFEFEELYKNEDNSEILIKSISKCPKCKTELNSRMFSSEKGEITT